MDKKVDRLIQYVKGLKDNTNGKELYLEYKDEIENVNPQECFEIFFSLLEEGIEPKEILVFLDKVINVFYKSLSIYKWEKPENDNFLIDLILENQALIERTNKIKLVLKETDLKIRKEKLLPLVIELKEFDDHYLKKENILFPYMEKAMPKFKGLSIMWELHDVVREQLNDAIEILKDINSTEEQLNIGIGNLFFGMLGIAKKEDLILFPSASEVIDNNDWYEMHKQSLEYGFPFISKELNELEDYNMNDKEDIANLGYKLKTDTGELDIEDVFLIFNALPVDITFVDEFNKVKYFSNTKDRIFPRSPAIIGREVKNCHPPASVHMVEEIVDSFRTGKEDNAKFWINAKERMLLIQYFSIRDKNNNYKGTLEVSQDITDIRALEGERRLLKWNE